MPSWFIKLVQGLCLLGQLALFGTVIWHTCGLTNVELALVGVGLVVFSAIVSLVNNLCCLCSLVCWSVGAAPAVQAITQLIFSTLLLGLTWGYDKVCDDSLDVAIVVPATLLWALSVRLSWYKLFEEEEE